MANKLMPCVAATLAFCAVTSTATASMELYLSDPTGDANEVEITPGQSFQVQVGYATTESTNGLSYLLNISDAGAGKFTITDRAFPSDCRFLDLMNSNAVVLASGAALLNPYNQNDLGALNASPSVPEPPGLYVLATVTITAAADLPLGTYTLSPVGAYGVNPAGGSVAMSTHDYTIVVSDGSGGTGDGSADSGNGTGDADNGGSGSGDQSTGSADTGDDTGSGDSGTGITNTDIAPVATTARCGAGVGGLTTLAALLALCFRSSNR